MKWLTCIVEDEIAEKVEELCKNLGISKSAFMRMIIIEKLAEASMLDEGTKKALKVLKV
jgi:predicted DNA-binding protein